MSLKFLAKKGWHTTNLDNVEKVWIAEQKAEKEKQKVIFTLFNYYDVFLNVTLFVFIL